MNSDISQKKIEYWKNNKFQYYLSKEQAKEITKDHKSWGNKVKEDKTKNRILVTIKGKRKPEALDIESLPVGTSTIPNNISTVDSAAGPVSLAGT